MYIKCNDVIIDLLIILCIVHYIQHSYFQNSFTDKCPSYNSYQGNMDENDCSTYYNATCPGVLYKSPSSVLCKCHNVL